MPDSRNVRLRRVERPQYRSLRTLDEARGNSDIRSRAGRAKRLGVLLKSIRVLSFRNRAWSIATGAIWTVGISAQKLAF